MLRGTNDTLYIPNWKQDLEYNRILDQQAKRANPLFTLLEINHSVRISPRLFVHKPLYFNFLILGHIILRETKRWALGNFIELLYFFCVTDIFPKCLMDLR